MKKTILVSADRGETRVAVLESKSKGGKRDVAELYIERRGRRSIVGNIYKGKVDNVLPGMEAAFVDIGLERNGFLHVDEIVLPDGTQAPKRGRGRDCVNDVAERTETDDEEIHRLLIGADPCTPRILLIRSRVE